MKKPLKEGNTGFRTRTAKIKFLGMFFLLSLNVFSQVPINGFCRYQQFNIEPGFKKFFPLNYNDDSYTDLLLFNPFDKKICSINGLQNSTFGESHLHNLQIQISALQYLRDNNQNVTGYSFISRKQSSAGIMKINSDGLPEIESVIRFSSYPENLSTADINGDGIPELLVSGSTFKGLSIISYANKLSEKNFGGNTSYPEAVFADLNNDQYPDIAAFEIFTNKLQFFYNNSNGEFNKVREIPVNNPLNQLQATDIDIDSYNDLIYSDNNEITVLYGDFSSSYNNSVVINTEFTVDKFITGDFNKDGKIDIAYINFQEGTLSLIFARENRKFYPELIYLKKDNLEDIYPYYSKFVDGITLLGENGKLYLVSNLSSFSDSVNIISGAYPNSISYFDKDNNGINDLSFIDVYKKSLNLLIRNSSGIPETWFPIPLFENETGTIVNNTNPQFKTFYCYTLNKKLIEVLKVDLKKFSYSRNILYASGKLNDIRLNGENGKLYTALLKNNKLSVSVFSEEDGKYSDYSIKDIHSNVLDATLRINRNPEVAYAFAENDSLFVSGRQLTVNKNYSEKNTGLKNIYNVILYGRNNTDNLYPSVLGFLTSDTKKNLFFPFNLNVPGKFNFTLGFRIKDKNQLFFGELKINSHAKLCLYDDDQHTIYSIDGTENNFAKNILADDIFTRSFFIKNMNSQAYHIVYVNKTENCISIKELK